MRSLVSVACIETVQIGQAFGGTRGLGFCSIQSMTAPNDLCGYDLDQKSLVVGLVWTSPNRQETVSNSTTQLSLNGSKTDKGSPDRKPCLSAIPPGPAKLFAAQRMPQSADFVAEVI